MLQVIADAKGYAIRNSTAFIVVVIVVLILTLPLSGTQAAAEKRNTSRPVRSSGPRPVTVR